MYMRTFTYMQACLSDAYFLDFNNPQVWSGCVIEEIARKLFDSVIKLLMRFSFIILNLERKNAGADSCRAAS